MRKSQNTPPDAAALRQRTEKRVRGKTVSSPADLAALSPDEARRALHELQLQQVELEMQNAELRRTQTELDAARTRYFELYDLAPVGYLTLRGDGLILEGNLAAATLLGVPRGALVNQALTDFVFPADQDLFSRHRRQLEETATPQSCELRMLRAGTVFWARLEAARAQAADGATVCHAVLSDITEHKRAEDAWLESETRYRLLAEQAGVAIGYYSLDGTILFLNDRACRHLGGDTKDYIGKSIFAVYGELEAFERLRRIRAVAASPLSIEHEDFVTLPSGQRWILSRHDRVVDAGGTVVGVQVISQDITDRREADDALRESEARFRSLFENAPVGVFYSTAEGKIVRVNAEFARILGYASPDEIKEVVNRTSVAETLYVAPPERAKTVLRAQAAVGSWIRGERRYRRKDGAEVLGNLMFRALPGSPHLLEGFVEDITERRRAEAALQASEARFRTLLHGVEDVAVQGYGPDGTTQYWNQASEQLYGYTAQEAIGRNLVDLIIPPEMRDFVAQAIREMAATGQPIPAAELLLLRKNGSRVPVFSSHTIVQVPGQPQELFCIDIDLTERRKAEAALRESLLFRHEAEKIGGIGAWKVNPRTDYLYWTEGVYEIVEAPPDYRPGLAEGLSLYTAESIPVLRQALHRALDHGTPFAIEVGLTTLKGRHVWAEVRGLARIGEGDETFVMGTLQDITERRRTEAALRESQETYRELVENLNDVIYTASAAGVLTYISPAAEGLLGYAPAEFIGRPLSDFIHRDDLPLLQTRLRNLLRGELAPSEYRVLTRSGEPRWIRSSSRPVLTAGQITGIQGVLTDITEHKQSEAVQQFLAQYSSGTAAEPFFAALARYLAANLGMESVCIDRLDGDGLTARTLAVWYDGKFQDNITYALEGTPCGAVVGKAVCCYPAGVCRTFPHDAFLQDIEAESYAGVTLWSHTGQAIGLIAVIGRRTLTNRPLVESTLQLVAVRAAGELERTLAEENLDRERRLLRTVIDNLPDGIYAKDRDARKTLANRADLATLGAASEADVLGKLDSDMLPPDVAAPMLADDLAVIRTGQPLLNAEEQVVDHAGKSRWLQTSKIPLRDSAGSVVGLVGIGHDITAIKAAQAAHDKLEAQLRQAHKMEAIGRLAGGIAHDFNNKLQTILGITELLLSGMAPDGPYVADMNDIMVAARRSADLTRQLLAFARRQTIAPKVLDLNDTVTGMFRMLARLIGEDIDLVWRPAAELWPVKMDPSQLDQILANLAVNARDAIAGVGRVTIATRKATIDDAHGQPHPDAVPGDYVVLEFSDSGCGMDAETMAHMFEPFFTTKPVGQGTGLGLATVYGIVRQNNGFIQVHSAPGQGAAFEICLPRHAATGAEAAAAPGLAVIARGTETVLLVEDEVPLLRLTGRILEGLGYTVLATDDPLQALQLAAQHAGVIHLLLTDVVMPEISGRTLQEQLSLTRPAMKCLFMSGYTADAIAHRGFLEEGLNFIQKPFSRAELAARLREVLAGSVAGNHYHPTEAGS